MLESEPTEVLHPGMDNRVALLGAVRGMRVNRRRRASPFAPGSGLRGNLLRYRSAVDWVSHSTMRSADCSGVN